MANETRKLKASDKKDCVKMMMNLTKSSLKKGKFDIKILKKESEDNKLTLTLEVKKNGKKVDLTDLNPFIFVNPPVCIILEDEIYEDENAKEPKVIKERVLEENPEEALKSIITDTLERVL